MKNYSIDFDPIINDLAIKIPFLQKDREDYKLQIIKLLEKNWDYNIDAYKPAYWKNLVLSWLLFKLEWNQISYQQETFKEAKLLEMYMGIDGHHLDKVNTMNRAFMVAVQEVKVELDKNT